MSPVVSSGLTEALESYKIRENKKNVKYKWAKCPVSLPEIRLLQ